jgi:predicted DNA-binding protein YlxM (UPF0122 family)
MKQRKNSDHKAGRPSEFTDDVVKKLEESFSIDATVEEACFYANISRQTYYNNVKEGTVLFDRFKALRERPVLLARQTAVSKLTESYQNAMDYLKRKRKSEFGDESRVEMKISKPFNVTPEQIEYIENLLHEAD